MIKPKPTTAPVARRGFSLLEALVALLLVAFGMLVLVGVNLKLARSEDIAKQRGEAARLAQEKIEDLRSFTQLTAGAGVKAWDTLAGGTETISAGGGYSTNTTFTRTTQLLGATTDAMRVAQVTVGWADRTNEAQSLSFATVISKTNPTDSGSLGFPLPANTTLKRPKNRNINIPVPAVDLGNGKSAFQLPGVVSGTIISVIFSNESGYVVQTCNSVVTTLAGLSACTNSNAYILAGYISGSFPVGLNLNTAALTGSTGSTCSLGNATDQNTGASISGYKYYLCVISVPTPGAPYSGTFRLGGVGLSAGPPDYLVCRFQYPAAAGVSSNQRNVQPYSAILDSLDTQNYIISTANSCPTVSGLATVEHQNCRSSGGNSVGPVQRLLNCPAT